MKKDKEGKKSKGTSTHRSSKPSVHDAATSLESQQKDSLKKVATSSSRNSSKSIFNWIRRKGSSTSFIGIGTSADNSFTQDDSLGGAGTVRRFSLAELSNADRTGSAITALDNLGPHTSLTECVSGAINEHGGFIAPDLNDLRDWHHLSIEARGIHKAKRVLFVTDAKRHTFGQLYSGLPVPRLRPTFDEDNQLVGQEMEDEKTETDKWNFIANRGFVRIYHRDENRHTTITADLNISCEKLCKLAARKFNVSTQDEDDPSLENNGHHLYVQSGSKLHPFTRKLDPDEQPLKIQEQWLQDLGYTEDDNLQLQGRTAIQHLIRFIYADSEANFLFRNLSDIISLELATAKASSVTNSAAHQKLNSKRTVDGSKTSLSNSSDRLPNANFAEDSALDLTGMDMWLPSRVAYIEAELKQRELHVCIEEVSFRSNMLFKPPEFLTSFLSLRSLDLSNNNLSILPSGLATACRNLNRLGLSDNNFRRVPPGVEEMAQLSTLDLSFNKLKDITSAAFPDQLTVLYLHKNHITVLGACLDNLVSLCTLNLAHNQLRRLPALELPRLVYLNLNGNSLSRGDMGTLRPQMLLCKANFLSLFSVDLSQLTEINLSRNKLQTLPDVFDKATALKGLNLCDNQLKELPKSVTSLARLETFRVRHNQLWSLPRMEDFRSLRLLDVAQNNLTYLPEDLFYLPNLKTLNASSNQIQLLPNLLYKQVIPLKKNVPLPTNCDWDNADNDGAQSSIDIITPEMNGDAGLNKDSNTNKEVSMSRDEIKSPSDSQSELGTTLHKLQRVTSDQAELLGSEEMSPRRRMSAETARVSGLKAEVQRIPMQSSRVSPSTSSLQTPPKYKKRSPNIIPPTSNSAGISTVSTPPSLSSKGTWGKRRKSKNMRNHYPSQNLCAIEVLLLGKNKLQTDCLLDSISQMSSLKELHLSHNNINELGHLRNLTSLRLLNMNSNSCMNVHSDVEYLSNLRSLSLCNNRLSLLPLSMSKLSKLEMLDLSENNIRYAGIHSWMWTSNPSVRVLNLARNKYLGITNLADIASLPNLEFISLAGVILPCRCKQTSAGLLDLYSRSASETQACSICFTASVPANLIKTICLEPKDYPKPDTLIRKATSRNSFPSSAYASPEGTSSATAITALTAEEATEKDIGLPVQSGVAQSNMNVKTIGQYSFTLNGIDFSELETAKSTFTIAKTHRVYGVFDAYGPTMADSHSSDNQKNVYHPNSVARIAYENFMPTFWEAIGRAFDGIDINNNITRSLRRAVLGVNRVVAERLPESNQYEGCSMAVLCMSRSRVWAANCGTTLSVLCRNGRAMPLSAKHTAKDEEERERVLQRGADVSASGELFGMTEATRGLGMFALQPFMNAGPHVVDHHISHDDEFIITACHGLWSCMSFQYAVEVVRHEYSPERAAQTLRDRATMLGVQRPITVVVTFTPKIRRAVRKEGLTTSLITHQTQDRSNAEVPPPHGKVTLVFTDIQGSTELWEEEEEAMRDAVRLHNELMRKLLLEHGGYEVKTEGDAFMVAFETSHAALKWALHAQTSLTETVWSEEILSRRSCREVVAEGPDGSQQTVFRGLRVRMGIHTGCPDCEADPITGRMDYFGPMVNRSARVSAIGQGGQIVISKHVWEEVESSLGPDTEVSVLGSYNLKGMKQKETIRQILPKTLHCRLEFFKKICAPPPPPIKVQSPISTQREKAIAHKSMSSPLHQRREKASKKRNDLAPATKPII